MKKIDGHAHIVDTIAGFNGKGRLNALGNGYAIWDDGDLIKLIPDEYGDKAFTAESFLKYMDANGVDKAVILQGHLNGYQNYYTHLAIKRYPERFTGAFSVDPFADNAMQIVKRHVEVLGFRAIKFEISQGGGIHGYRGQKTPFRLDTDPHVSRILTYLLDYPGFVVTVDYGNWDQISHQPDAIANLARLYRVSILLFVTSLFHMLSIQIDCVLNLICGKTSTISILIFQLFKILMPQIVFLFQNQNKMYVLLKKFLGLSVSFGELILHGQRPSILTKN